MGASLAAIAAEGDRAGRLADKDPASASAAVGAAVARARRTMADVRRLVRGYQALPVPAELRRVLRLLDAAGIRTRLVLPPGDLPATLPEEQRVALRARIAAILSSDSIHDCVCTVLVDNGSITIDLSTKDPRSRPNVTAA